ncbi:MAG: zf-HC2 domain-containing protein [Actinomycetota bacterium]
MTAARVLTCRELVELVTEYLDGTMAPAERALFDAHVAACPGCRTYLDQFRDTVRTLGHLPQESLSPAARDALLHAFRDWHAGR